MRLSPTSRSSRPGANGISTSRSALIAFAEENQIPIAKDKRGEAPFSVDANLLHVSSEGKVLEDPAHEVPDYVYSRTVNPEDAPNEPNMSKSTSSEATRSPSMARRCPRDSCSRI